MNINMICKLFLHVLLLGAILIEESESKWNLVWNDEFNYQTLDTDKWEIENESNPCHG